MVCQLAGSLIDRLIEGVTESSTDARSRILDAAEKLFAARGFDGVTIKDIGTEARQNAALLYYYFDSKETLFREVLARGVSQLIEDANRRIQASHNPDDVVSGVVAAQATMVARHASLPRLLMRAMLATHGPELIPAVRQLSEQIFTRLRDAIIAGQRLGRYRSDLDPTFSAISIISQVAYLVLAWPVATILLERERDGISAVDVEAFAQHAASFALGALRAAPNHAAYSTAAEGSLRNSE
jgi:AcrR family transcriptional regulator